MFETKNKTKTYSVLYSFEEEFKTLTKPFCSYFFTKSKKEDKFKIYYYKISFRSLQEELNYIKALREFEIRHKTELMRIFSNVEVKPYE